MYPLAKFQLWELQPYKGSNNRKIDMYSKYRENKLQALTKTVVTYQQIEVRSYNFHHRVRHEWESISGYVFPLITLFTAYKNEFVKKNRSLQRDVNKRS